MSDDEMHYDDSDEEFAFDDDINVMPAHYNRQPAPPAPALPPPQPQLPMMGNMMRNMFQGFGGMGPAAGWGGHAFGVPSASSFSQSYTAYSTALLEVMEGKGSARLGMAGSGRDNVNFGGKIIMPPSALQLLTQLDIESPWMFQLNNPRDNTVKTHAGVLEFIAQEGNVHLPQWMMQRLHLAEGDRIRIQGARLPKGKFVKVQAQSVDFLELSDPKAVLEQAFRNYAAVSEGDKIEIAHNSITFGLLIMEAKPDANGISVIDTDLEVDFAAPLGYVEPTPQPRAPPPTMASKLNIQTGASTSATSSSAPAGPSAFVGQGNSLGGKRVKGKGTTTKKIEAVDEGSRILRTDRPRVITADTPDVNARVPAALTLPHGTLFFGFPVVPLGDATNRETAAHLSERAPFAGAGQGASLSGRIRSEARASPVPESPKPAAIASELKEESKSFAGQGNTLSGRAPPKPRDVIEID